MPMADAVLAQIVPVKGAILLDGEAALLQRKVQVVKGMNRKDTLVAMAKATGVTINLSNGNTVVVSPAQIGTVPGITVQETSTPGNEVATQTSNATTLPSTSDVAASTIAADNVNQVQTVPAFPQEVQP